MNKGLESLKMRGKKFSFKSLEHDVLSSDETQNRHQILIDLAAGLASCFLQFVFAMSYAAGCFSDPRSSSKFGVGVMMAALATFVTQIGYCWQSEIPYLFVSPDSFYIPLIMSINDRLSSLIKDDNNFQHTYIFAIAFATVLVGSTKILAGYMNVVKFTDYIPYPAICGLMAGIGINLIQVGIILSTQNEWANNIRFIPPLCFAIISVVAHAYHCSPSKSFLSLILGSFIIFYVVIIWKGMNMDQLEADNWTFSLRYPVPSLWVYGINERSSFHLVDWSAIWACRSHFISMSILMVLKISLTIPAYEKALKSRYNKSLELSKYGLGTILAGLCGGAGTSPSLSITMIVLEMGGSGRLPVIIAPLIFIVLYLSNFSCIVYAPKFIFAGLLLSSGYQMIMSWLVLPMTRIPPSESMILIVIILVYLTRGMLFAMGVGSGLSVLLFSYKFHQAGCVKCVSGGEVFHSSKERTDHIIRAMRKYRHRIKIVMLQGYIAFANADQLYDIASQIFLSVEQLDSPAQDGETGHSKPASCSDKIFSPSQTAAATYEYLHEGLMVPAHLLTAGDSVPQKADVGRDLRQYTFKGRDRVATFADTSLPSQPLESKRTRSMTWSYQLQKPVPALPSEMSFTDAELLPPLEEDSGETELGVSNPNPLKPFAIILHMNDVLGCDASAMDIFSQLALLCRSKRCHLVLSSVGDNEASLLTKAGILTQSHVSLAYDLDEALAHMEDALLRHHNIKEFAPSSASTDPASKEGFVHCIRLLRQNHPSHGHQSLLYYRKFAVPLMFKAGQVITAHRKVPSLSSDKSMAITGFFFVEEGVVSQRLLSDTASVSLSRSSASLGHSSPSSSGSPKSSGRNSDSHIADFELVHNQDALSGPAASRHGPGWAFEDISRWDQTCYVAEAPTRVQYIPGDAIDHAREMGAIESYLSLYRLKAWSYQVQLDHAREQLSNLVDVMHFKAGRTKNKMT